MTHSSIQTKLIPFLAKLMTFALSAALFVCANTNSSCMFHQSEEPAGLDKFRKIK